MWKRFLALIGAIALASPTAWGQTLPASSPRTEWPLPGNSIIRFGKMDADTSHRLVVYESDVLASTGDAGTATLRRGGYSLVDLRTGKVDLVTSFSPSLEKKSYLRALLSPNAEKLAMAVFVSNGEWEVRDECFLVDIKTHKVSLLTECAGGMGLGWMGDDLIVSKRGKEEVGKIERYTASGQTVEMPAIYGWIIATSADGQRAMVVARPDDPSRGLKADERSVAAIVMDGKWQALRQIYEHPERKGLMSPSGKFGAFATVDNMRSTRERTVVAVHIYPAEGKAERSIDTPDLPVAVTDEGVLYTISQPTGGTVDRNAEPSQIKRWDVKGQAKVIAKDALDACMGGKEILYIAAGTPPTLKAIPAE